MKTFLLITAVLAFTATVFASPDPEVFDNDLEELQKRSAEPEPIFGLVRKLLRGNRSRSKGRSRGYSKGHSSRGYSAPSKGYSSGGHSKTYSTSGSRSKGYSSGGPSRTYSSGVSSKGYSSGGYSSSGYSSGGYSKH